MKEKLIDGKVIFFIPSMNWGGAENQAFLLAKYLKDIHSIPVEFWFLKFSTGPLYEKINKEGIPWLVLPIRRNYLLKIIDFVRVIRLINRDKIFVLISYLRNPNVYGSVIAKFSNIKFHIWNQRNEGLNISNLVFLKIASRLSKNFISNSKGGKIFLKKTLKIPENKIKIIYNGIHFPDMDRIKKCIEERKKALIKNKEFNACMIANIKHTKDHKTLIIGWNKFHKQYSNKLNLKLYLVGRKDNTYNQLLELISSEGIKKSDIIFTGHLENSTNILKKAHVGILISDSEGLSNTIVEYMSFGLPVISTEILNIKDTVSPENLKYLIPLKNPRILANTLTNIVEDYNEASNIGIDNYYYGYSRYNENTNFKEFYQYINSLSVRNEA